MTDGWVCGTPTVRERKKEEKNDPPRLSPLGGSFFLVIIGVKKGREAGWRVLTLAAQALQLLLLKAVEGALLGGEKLK